MLDQQFWQNRYQTGETPWDLGQASPHWVALMAEKGTKLKLGRMAVLGCGRGHDAAFFQNLGFDVVGFDYSEAALLEAEALYGVDSANPVQFEWLDVTRPAELPEPHQHAFDYVLEHTCFCAIMPRFREAYVQTVRALLKPEGRLLGIFWEHGAPDGPPFSTTLPDVHGYFDADFTVEAMTEKTPIAQREGIERVMILRQKKEF